MKTYKTSYTFTKEQLWAELKPYYIDVISSTIEDFLEGDDYSVRFLNQKSKVDENVIFWWEICSERFFNNNPQVEDVLLMILILIISLKNGWLVTHLQKQRLKMVINL